MPTKNTVTRISGLFAVAATLAFAGCSSTPTQAQASANATGNADMSKAVAKMIAKNASAPLLFKDQGGVNDVTASISETSALKFALVLDRDLKQFGKYFAAP